MTQRSKLEKEYTDILNMLSSGETQSRVRFVNRLNEIVEEIERLDKGENWTQVIGDTLTNISVAGLRQLRKVMRKV